MVVIGLQLFKGDPNNENLTKLEHTHSYIHTQKEFAIAIISPYSFSSQGKIKMSSSSEALPPQATEGCLRGKGVWGTSPSDTLPLPQTSPDTQVQHVVLRWALFENEQLDHCQTASDIYVTILFMAFNLI